MHKACKKSQMYKKIKTIDKTQMETRTGVLIDLSLICNFQFVYKSNVSKINIFSNICLYFVIASTII